CSQCAKSFSRRFNLKTHEKTHDASRARPFGCSACPKSFVRIADLRRHEEIHARDRARRELYGYPATG
ncbi:hypothetical protein CAUPRSCDRAFT_976, partial [Caulochytrium protostelioides]